MPAYEPTEDRENGGMTFYAEDVDLPIASVPTVDELRFVRVQEINWEGIPIDRTVNMMKPAKNPASLSESTPGYIFEFEYKGIIYTVHSDRYPSTDTGNTFLIPARVRLETLNRKVKDAVLRAVFRMQLTSHSLTTTQMLYSMGNKVSLKVFCKSSFIDGNKSLVQRCYEASMDMDGSNEVMRVIPASS